MNYNYAELTNEELEYEMQGEPDWDYIQHDDISDVDYKQIVKQMCNKPIRGIAKWL